MKLKKFLLCVMPILAPQHVLALLFNNKKKCYLGCESYCCLLEMEQEWCLSLPWAWRGLITADDRVADIGPERCKEALSPKASRGAQTSHASSSRTVFPVLELSGGWDTEVLFLEGDLQALEVASSLSLGQGSLDTQQDAQPHEACPCC